MGIYITVKVTPGAKKEHIKQGTQTDIACWVKAPAQDGKANDALTRLLAKALGCPVRDITVLAGHTARIKRLYIESYTSKQELYNALEILVQHVLCDVASN